MDYQSIQADEIEALSAIYDDMTIELVDSVLKVAFPSMVTFAFTRSASYPVDKVCPQIEIPVLEDKYSMCVKSDIINCMKLKGQEAVVHGQVCLFEMIDAGINLIRSTHASVKSTKKAPPPIQRTKAEKTPAKTPKNKAKKAEESVVSEKKSMRTATDVIHRIMWDDQIDQAEVIVGYLDRFVGIMERNFSSFNWGDIATLSHAETAIPQHRIQYFSWRGEVIWDKRCRMDRVFGSSGHEVITFTPKPVGKSAKEEVVEIKPAPASFVPTFHSNTDRPNAFLCFRIQDAAIVELLKQVQTAIISRDPRLASAAIPLQRLHCTLVLMRLKSIEDLWTARRVLSECQGLLHSTFPNPNGVNIKGVGHFGNRVIYADVEPNAGLTAFVTIVKTRLSAAGIQLVGNHDPYVPHITLCKLSRELNRSIASIDHNSYAAFANVSFGTQAVGDAHLCSMAAKVQTTDGFYQRFGCIKNKSPELTRTWDFTVSKGQVVVLRGVPGSGKSTLSRCIQDYCASNNLTSQVCSADDFFNGTYDRSLLADAHASCKQKFAIALESKIDVIIVDNTNLQVRHVKEYLDVASSHDYRATIFELVAPNVQACIRRSCHAVPLEKYSDGPEPFTEGRIHVKTFPAYFPDPVDTTSSIQAENIGYGAIFLDKQSRQRLLQQCKPAHAKVLADHVTVAYAPSAATLSKLHLGTTVKLLVMGEASNSENHAVVVRCPEVGAWENDGTPHITISISSQGSAKNSSELLRTTSMEKWQTPLALSGVIGLFVPGSKKVVTTFGECVDVLLPNDTPVFSYQLKSPAVTSVHVFDFDLTLVRAPPRHHGESVLTAEEIASIGKDWYKSPLSLNYKLKLVPLPALALLKSILGSTSQMGVVLTARHEHLRGELLSVLKKFGVEPDLAVLKPNNMHKDLTNHDSASQVSIRAAENAAYKIAAIEALILSPSINNLKIYEDDDAILKALYSWATTVSERRPHLTIQIVDAKLLNKPFSVIQYLKNLDCVPTDNSHCERILRELQQVSNAKAVVPFGSYALHRRGDIDVCLVIKDNESHRDAVLRVADALRQHGVHDVYESGSSRCPLLKVHWLDPLHPPVDLDIVFVQTSAYDKFIPGSTRISVQSTDPNERSLMGLDMLHQIQSLVQASPISMDVFARVVDTVLLVLKAKCVHGTHFNGLPSFKVSALVASYISGLTASAPLKDVVSGFFSYAASISQVEWEDKWLNGVYVSPHLLVCAQQALFDAKNATQDASFPSSGTLSRLTQGREPSAQAILSLRVVYADENTWMLKQQFNWKFAKALRDLYQAHRIEVDPMPEAPQMERTFGLLGDVTTTINFFTEFARVTTSESNGSIVVDVVGTAAEVVDEDTDIVQEVAYDGLLAKFPRTKHLMASKNISRDDLVLDPTDAAVFMNTQITIQEKVDGANLGLFLTDDFKVVAQNRSHFCNSETAPQFKGLDIWIQMHQFELIDLLSPPGRYVLYGEWLFAQHSIAYSKLPSYFLAFDIFDRSNQTFWSVDKVQERLEETSIHMVPTLFTGVYKDLNQFQSLLETTSKYYDGPVEGIVIRKEASGVLLARAKLVRDDFIQNIDDHWAKKGVVKNQLQFL